MLSITVNGLDPNHPSAVTGGLEEGSTCRNDDLLSALEFVTKNDVTSSS